MVTHLHTAAADLVTLACSGGGFGASDQEKAFVALFGASLLVSAICLSLASSADKRRAAKPRHAFEVLPPKDA